MLNSMMWQVVQREAGPRIVKPSQTSPKAEETKSSQTKKPLVKPKSLVTIAKKAEPACKPNTPKATHTNKIPDFKAIHARNFGRQEDVKEVADRHRMRHHMLTSGAKPAGDLGATARDG